MKRNNVKSKTIMIKQIVSITQEIVPGVGMSIQACVFQTSLITLHFSHFTE